MIRLIHYTILILARIVLTMKAVCIREGVKAEHVKQLPYDIDGNTKYEVPYNKIKQFESTKDGRYWGHLSKSRRQGFDGDRFLASCKGSFHCTNVDCLHTVEFSKPNRVQFTPKGNFWSCGKQVERVICNLRKFWEFKKSSATVTIKHCGIQNCSPRKRATSTAADEFKKRPSTRPCELRKNVFGRPHKIWSNN